MEEHIIIYRIHARDMMQERDITNACIEHILVTGEVIEDYPNDFPYPSRLLMGWYNSRCIHVVVAEDGAGKRTIIVTAYEPNLIKWKQDMKTRREP